MSRTTFSGPVASNNGFIFPDVTAAALGDIADVINTEGKVAGKSVIDIATGVIYTATGDQDSDDWNGSDATTITPA